MPATLAAKVAVPFFFKEEKYFSHSSMTIRLARILFLPLIKNG